MALNNPASSSAHLLEPQFAERWLGLGYTYSGTFILDGADLTPERARVDIGALYLATRAHRQRKFVRGLARFLLIPVYCAPVFDRLTRDYLYGYDRPGRWAVALHPVLFNSQTNTIEAKDAAQNNTLGHYWYLQQLFSEGTSRASRHFGLQPEFTKDSYDDLVAKLISDRNE